MARTAGVFAAFAVMVGCGAQSLDADAFVRSAVTTCSATVSSAQTDGGIAMTASSTCGANPLYQFYVQRPWDGRYQLVRDYASDPTFVWESTNADSGRYSFMVWVKDAASGAAFDSWATTSRVLGDVCTSATLAIRQVSGSVVSLYATASCAQVPANPEYRFLVRPPGASTYTELRGYGLSQSFDWNTAGRSAGRYDLLVYARLSGNGSTYESYATVPYFVGSTCTGATIAGSPGSGTTVNLSASAMCSSPEYQFLARPQGTTTWSEIRGYRSASGYAWDTAGLAAGRYDILTYVRQSGNASSFETYATTSAMIGTVCSSATAAVTKVEGADGQYDVTASASCDGVDPEFRFLVRAPGASTPSEVRAYDAGASYRFDTAGVAPGRYELIVYARASGNTSAYEAYATAPMSVGDTCATANLWVVTDAANSVVRMGGDSTCSGAAAPEFEFRVRAPGAAAYSVLRPYSTEPSFSWDTAGLPMGRYDVAVYARAAGNTSAYESYGSTSVTVGTVCTYATLQAAARAGSSIVDLQSTAYPEGVTPEFKFLVRAPGSSTFTALRPYAPDATFAWDTAGLTSGKYLLLVYVRAAGSASSYEAYATEYYTVP